MRNLCCNQMSNIDHFDLNNTFVFVSYQVHPDTGLLSTALCCLDRETTPEYHLQVVATDGGGLKGHHTKSTEPQFESKMENILLYE